MPENTPPPAAAPRGAQGPAEPVTDDSPEWQQRQAAQLEEYGTWIAAVPIYHGTAMAYDTGHPIPNDNVARLGYDKNGSAVKRTSAAGKKILRSLGVTEV